MSTRPLRPPLRSEHESQIGLSIEPGPTIRVNGHLIPTPHGFAGGFSEFCRAQDIVKGATP